VCDVNKNYAQEIRLIGKAPNMGGRVITDVELLYPVGGVWHCYSTICNDCERKIDHKWIHRLQASAFFVFCNALDVVQQPGKFADCCRR
jgi:hypothetical protein